MTTEQLKQNAAAMIAFADGKPIQYQACDKWHDCSGIGQIDSTPHRPKPEPVSRPWDSPEDVPGSVCWMRLHSDGCVASEQLITFIGRDGVVFGGDRMIWSKLASYLYSTDRKTWLPCTVRE